MSGLEAFLDDTPGETRGIVARDGRFEHLLIQRDGDSPQARLGARSVGRVVAVAPGLNAAFVDLGVPGPAAFLPLGQGGRVLQGEILEVQTTTEPRETKGPTVRRIGQSEGAPRLIAPGPDVRAELARLAPDVPIQTGAAAIQAGCDAEEEALAATALLPALGLDMAVERTRALIAVDLDHVPVPGRDARKDRQHANLEGLRQAARLIRLKSWGGLVAIDLIGTRLDAEGLSHAARAAFADDPEVVLGPLNRFGVLQLSMPWRRTPIEERLTDRQATAIATVRRLRLHLLQDTATPRFTVRCAPNEAELAGPLVARLGPRAAIVSDPAVRPGHAVIQEG